MGPGAPALPGREALIRQALGEDLGLAGIDLTATATVPAATPATARLVTRQDGRLAGLDLALESFRQLDPGLAVEVDGADGDAVAAGTVLARVSGAAQPILAGERVALNFLGHLSGIATATAQAVAAVDGACAICDTRKTTPGLRAAEKYAVRCGGGRNHRFALDDALLVKENHIAAAGGLGPAVRAARAQAGHMRRLAVEIEEIEQIDDALAGGADSLLFDNMAPADLSRAVARTAGRAVTEASGGLALADLPAVAGTGVDAISLGWLTHSAPALDVALELAGPAG